MRKITINFYFKIVYLNKNKTVSTSNSSTPFRFDFLSNIMLTTSTLNTPQSPFLDTDNSHHNELLLFQVSFS